MALDTGTEAELHSAKVSFNIYLTQWKSIDFRRHWLNSPTTFNSFHTFSYGVSHTLRWSLHCTSLLLFWSQPLLLICFSPFIYFSTLSKQFADAIWSHFWLLIKHKRIKLKLLSIRKTKILIPITVYLVPICIHLLELHQL